MYAFMDEPRGAIEEVRKLPQVGHPVFVQCKRFRCLGFLDQGELGHLKRTWKSNLGSGQAAGPKCSVFPHIRRSTRPAVLAIRFRRPCLVISRRSRMTGPDRGAGFALLPPRRLTPTNTRQAAIQSRRDF